MRQNGATNRFHEEAIFRGSQILFRCFENTEYPYISREIREAIDGRVPASR